MPLAKIRLRTSIAYPVIEPPLDWAVTNLVIWDKITFIWDPNDRQSLDKFATRTPILLDRGLVQLAAPAEADVLAASTQLTDLLHTNPANVPEDPEFAKTFVLHPVKLTGKYWDDVRRSGDGFVHVPPHIGALYVGLLASEMARRQNNATVSIRSEEALWVVGSNAKRLVTPTTADCVGRAAFNVLCPTLRDPLSTDVNVINGVCDDILALRRLDEWHAWREHLCGYLDAVGTTTPSPDHIAEISRAMNEAVNRFQTEAQKHRRITLAKGGATILGSGVGFLVGDIPGAIASAITGGASLAIDLYEARLQHRVHTGSWQHFVVEAKRRFD